MMRVIGTLGAVALTAGTATAGALDRSGQSTAILFEQGNYAEYSLGYVDPRVSGVVAVPGGLPSGDMTESYLQFGGAVKMRLSDTLDAALIIDQPFGADVSYPSGTGYPFGGTTAELNTVSVTGVLKYRLPSNVSLYAGLRYQTLEADAGIPILLGYTVSGERDGGFGYLLGVAYERPDIALRVALTYNSSISHSLPTFETGVVVGTSTTEVDTPQSVNLEFQTGVAEDTLLFGSIRWVDWTEFVINPANYGQPAPLVSYDADIVTYSLGVGRRLNENWAASLSLGYERQVGGLASNLGPTDGRKSITLGGTYTQDKVKVTGGISYIDIGDAQTGLPATFSGNKAVGVGVRVGYFF